ncbi:hypothetical protein B9Z55_005926 [Caenorhabditis nigoni]|uniref:Uncharacterized protein n=1 Tax=Caenorhabditis nigoni TaxID=1611254 RepID=A0A2G5V2W8_9PELO|nr:hypothetical protein B9Z55_005926 [Caenorhabditis nigoni]
MVSGATSAEIEERPFLRSFFSYVYTGLVALLFLDLIHSLIIVLGVQFLLIYSCFCYASSLIIQLLQVITTTN